MAEGDISSNDSRMQKGLRGVGRKIGRHPRKWGSICCFVYVVLILAGFMTRKMMGGSKDFMDPEDLDLQWCLKGGETEKNLKRYKKEFDNDEARLWQSSMSTTHFVTYNHDDDKKNDILTRRAFLEILEVHKLYFTLNVTVKNKTYSTYDLCSRGVLPDLAPTDWDPYPSRVTPCLIVTPIHCFKEAVQLTHPSYQLIDPVANSYVTGAATYSVRPSLVESSDAEIKANLSLTVENWTTLLTGRSGASDEDDSGPVCAVPMKQPEATVKEDGVARGCQGASTTQFFYSDLWVGKPEWSDHKLSKAKGVRGLFYLDAVARIQYRMNLTKPEHAVPEDIRAAIRKHSKLWQKTCSDWSTRSKVIQIANLQDWDQMASEDMEHELEQLRAEFYSFGLGLLLLYGAMTLIKCNHPAASRGSIGYLGMGMVIISIFGAFGILLIFDVHPNGAMALAVPLLGMGIGLDDMFVFLRYFSGLGHDFVNNQSYEEIIGELLAQAGPGAALTSACNVVVFFCGYFLPVRAMANFCLLAMLVALCNFMTLVNLFLPALCWEIKRMKLKKIDPVAFTCQRNLSKNEAADMTEVHLTSSMDFKKGCEKSLVGFIQNKYAPLLCKPGPKIGVSMCGVVLLIVSCVLISTSSVGYSPHEIFPSDNPNHDGMKHLFETFSLFPTSLVFWDVDVNASQIDLVTLWNQFTETKHGAPNAMPNILTLLYLVLFEGAKAEMEESGATFCPEEIAKFVDLQYNGWNNTQFAPAGVLSDFYAQFNDYRGFPANPEEAWTANQGFNYMDMGGANQFKYNYSDQSLMIWDRTPEELKYSRMTTFYFPALNIKMDSEDLFIDAINEGKDILKNAPASLKDKAFLYGPILVFWEVFTELEPQMFMIMGIDAVIIFVVTLVFFSFDVITAAITCLSCVMIVLEIYGLSVAIMHFNIFVAAISLMAMGMSVEFTAHLAAAFSLGAGDIEERLGDAMTHTFPALWEGSISTFFGVFPLFFHPQMFIVKYVATIMSMVVIVGMLNGVLIMPAMLALISPCLRRKEKRKRDMGALLPFALVPGDEASNKVQPVVVGSAKPPRLCQ